jgi:hypothetical protein
MMVTLQLTPQQIALPKPIVTEEPKKPVLFVATAAPHWNGDWKLQVERMKWKSANKILKIINNAKLALGVRASPRPCLCQENNK